MKRITTLLVLSIALIACNPKNEVSSVVEKTDPLPSWNEGVTKQSILDYVNEVTNPKNETFIPIKDRIATFDNDGNL